MYDAHYGRQSVDKKDSISVESQLEFCKFETRGGKFKEYIDKGFNGKNTNRPAFTEMCSDIERGLIKKVIVYKLDRISRSILDFSNMMEFFQKHNVEFLSSTEKFDTSTPMGRAMLNICIVFAQLERETIQKRVIDSLRSRSTRGFYTGSRVAYGFKLEDFMIDGVKTARYIPIKEEVEQLKLFYSLYSKPNTTLGDIVRYCREHEIVPLRGREWDITKLGMMLDNPIYVKADSDVYDFYKSQGTEIINDVSDFVGTNGCYLHTTTKPSETRKPSRRCLENKFLVVAPHEGIVSSYEWLQCRLKFLNNKQFAPSSKGKNSWLLGKVKCANCKRAISVLNCKEVNKRYFRCRGRSHDKSSCIGCGKIIADHVEAYIFEVLKTKLSEFTELKHRNKSVVDPKIQEHKIRISQIDGEIESLLKKVSNANEILMNYINEKVEQLDIERKQLQEKILTLSKSTCDTSVNNITNCIEHWEKTNIEERMSVVDAFIQAIYLQNNDVEIVWKT